MKITLAFSVILCVCSPLVFGCAPSLQLQRPKEESNLGCATTQRFRQICRGNPDNHYRKEELNIPDILNRTSRNDTHDGLDIKCSPGSSVYAPFRGRITYRDHNSLKITGLRTFKGMTFKMTNFHVLSSLSVNMSVLAAQYIGNMTETRPHEELEETNTNYIHIDLLDNALYNVHPSWFVCPAVEWRGTSPRFMSQFSGRFIPVDHDKFQEEVGDKEEGSEGRKGDKEEGSGDDDDEDDEGSGKRLPTTGRPSCREK